MVSVGLGIFLLTLAKPLPGAPLPKGGQTLEPLDLVSLWTSESLGPTSVLPDGPPTSGPYPGLGT